MDMLSTKKVNLHGISTSKWTKEDKMTQYKGLINLFERDNQIITADLNAATRNQKNSIGKIRKEISIRRACLDNCVRGDKEKLRTTLQKHKRFQLAYQDLPPKKAIDNIEHKNFRKRKELDRINESLDKKKQELFNLKLELSLLEDRYKEEQEQTERQLDLEKAAQTVAGKIQDVILKQDIAVSIRETYTNIRDTMSKDSIYFDAILNVLKNDGLTQSQCIINATTLGQLATEYLDDRKWEFKRLEALVQTKMSSRKGQLKMAEEIVRGTRNRMKHSVRRESDINLCRSIEDDDIKEMKSLRQNLQNIENTLERLGANTYALSFDKIYQSLEDQNYQYEYLKELVRNAEEGRDRLLNKLNHAQLIHAVESNTMSKSTQEYVEQKKELKKKIEEQIERKRQCEKLTKTKQKILTRVGIQFKNILEYVRPIRVVERRENEPDEGDGIWRQAKRSSLTDDEFVDVMKILRRKLGYLYQCVQDEVSVQDEHKAYQLYEENVLKRNHSFVETKTEPKDLLENVYFGMPKALTREEIKKKSAEIVRINLLKREL